MPTFERMQESFCTMATKVAFQLPHETSAMPRFRSIMMAETCINAPNMLSVTFGDFVHCSQCQTGIIYLRIIDVQALTTSGPAQLVFQKSRVQLPICDLQILQTLTCIQTTHDQKKF